MDHQPRKKKSNKARRTRDLHGKFTNKAVRRSEELSKTLSDTKAMPTKLK